MRRLRRILVELARSERGIALPMALMVTVVGMGLAAVPVVASVNSQGGNQHNEGGNEALAAAEAGAEIALQEQGDLHIKNNSEQLCVSEEGVAPQAGWCPPEPVNLADGKVTPGTVGLASYTYRVLPCYGVGATYSDCDGVAEAAKCEGLDPVEVVSTGTATVAGRPVERRVSVSGCALSAQSSSINEEVIEAYEAELKLLNEKLTEYEAPARLKLEIVAKWQEKRSKLEGAIAREIAEGETRFKITTSVHEHTVEREVPAAVFGGGQIVGIESLIMNNGADVYSGGAGSNEVVSMTGNAQICGSIRYGTTFTATNGSDTASKKVCPGGRTVIKSPPITYPPVQLPANIATQNSDARLSGLDPASGNQRSNVKWNESKHELIVEYGQLTLEGTLPYYFCKLTLQGGSKLVSGAGKSIRFFFPEPTQQNCPGLNGSPTQLVINNGAEITADSNHGPGFFFVGSPTKGASKIELGGGANVSQFVVYAPHSVIYANNGVNLRGSIIGQTLEIQGGSGINQGAFTPPPSSEFTAPEIVKETVQEPVSESVETQLGKNEDELVVIEETIRNLTLEIKVILESELIVKTKEKITQVSKEKSEYEANNGGSVSINSTSFQKSGFAECTATPPSGKPSPSAGC